MNKINYIISLVLLLFVSFVNAQDDDLPSIDFKNEKFENIKSKLTDYLGKMITPDDEESRGKTEALRQWMDEMESHLDVNGHLFNYNAKNFSEFLKLKNQKDVNNSLASSGGSWFPKFVNSVSYAGDFGSGRTGLGRINTIEFDPIDPNVIYAGASSGGLWQTTDGGTNWACITNGIPNAGISSIAINPSNANNIFIATGTWSSCFVGFQGEFPSIGVLVTYDRGLNWFQTGFSLSATANVYCRRIKIAPADNNIILITTDAGIYRSTDSGLNFILVKPSTLSAGFYDLEFLPGTSTCFATEGTILYRSVNNGQNWTVVPAGNFNQPVAASGKIELAVTPANVNYLYMLVRNNSDSVFLSVNANSTFTFTYKTEISSMFRYQPTFSDAFAVSPTTPAIVYAGDGKIAKSAAGGNFGTWVTKTDWGNGLGTNYVHEDIHEIKTRGASEVFAASDGGLFKSSDGGNTWTMLGQQIDVAEFQGFGGIQSDPNYFVGGTWHNAFHKYNSGISYNIGCCDEGDAMIHPSNPDIIYFAQGFVNGPYGNDIWKTTDGGDSLYPLLPAAGCGCADTIGSNQFRFMQMNPQNPNTIYVLFRNLWVSFNGGTNWTQRITGATSSHQAFAQSPTDTLRFYAVRGNMIYGSANSGIAGSWTLLYTTPGGTGTSIKEITVKSSDPNTFYFVYNGYNSSYKVKKGVWNGSGLPTISDYNGTLPNIPVYKVIHQNTTTPGIYIGTDIGVFFRADAGTDWVEFNSGLPYCKVVDLEINYPNGLISAATYGRGIWQSPVYENCPADYNHGPIILNPPVYGNEYFEASNSITSGRLIQGGYGTNVTFNAGNYAQLNVGFEVKAGSEFHAYIDGCSNPSPIQLNGVFAGYLPDEKEANDFLTHAKNDLAADKLVIFPNPANSTVHVFFNLRGTSKVELSLYDQESRLLKKIFDESLSGNGINAIPLDVSDLSGGIYFCVLKTGNHIQSEKLIVRKK